MKNEKFQENLSRPGIIDATARWLRNTTLKDSGYWMYHSDFALIVCLIDCVCVCVSYDSANFTHTVHIELNVTILTHAMIFLNSINGCDSVTDKMCLI